MSSKYQLWYIFTSCSVIFPGFPTKFCEIFYFEIQKIKRKLIILILLYFHVPSASFFLWANVFRSMILNENIFLKFIRIISRILSCLYYFIHLENSLNIWQVSKIYLYISTVYLRHIKLHRHWVTFCCGYLKYFILWKWQIYCVWFMNTSNVLTTLYFQLTISNSKRTPCSYFENITKSKQCNNCNFNSFLRT